MNGLGQEIWAGLRDASALDQANLVLGIAGVGLMVRRSLWAFPVGLVAVTVQGVLFFQTRYYADAVLQGVFFGVLVHGWWHWVRGRGEARELPVTTVGWRARVATVGAAGGATVVWAWWLGAHTDAVMPWRDAFIAAFSVAAQGLQARKHLENWPLWIGVNVVAVASYAAGGLVFTAVLYAVYLGLACAGWRSWRRSMEGQNSPDRNAYPR